MILVMASAGLRRGALPGLRLKDLQKIDKYDLYKITVYKKEHEQYITYCTSECVKQIDKYVEWRASLGEQLRPSSILFRPEFNTTSKLHLTANSKPFRAESIGHVIADLLDKTSVRPRTRCKTQKSSLMALSWLSQVLQH